MLSSPEQTTDNTITADLPDEEWRSVPGYEGAYEVSNLGRVRSVDRVVPHPRHGSHRRKGKLLAPRPDTGGYLQVTLSRHGALKCARIHRLVLHAFVGECPDSCEVNHKDGNPRNNHLSNLEYVTHRKNIQHSYTTLKRQAVRGEQSGRSKLTEEVVRAIRQEYAEGNVTCVKLAEQYSVGDSTIHRIVHWINWIHLDSDSPSPECSGSPVPKQPSPA